MQDGVKELNGGSLASGEHEQHVQFSAPGVRGEVTLIPHPEGGRMLELGHLLVDSARIAERIDPRFHAELEKQFGSDEATRGFVRSEAERWVERLLAYEALLSDVEAKGDGALVTEVKAALERAQKEIAIRFKGLPVLRDVNAVAATDPTPVAASPAPETSPVQEVKPAQEAKIEDPALVNPDALQFTNAAIWTPARQEAARNVIRYHQGLARALDEELRAYIVAHADDPKLKALQKKLAETREKALSTDEYSVQDMARRVAANDPGAIPALELSPGAKTMQDSVVAEAKQLFESWVHAV